MSLVGCFAKSGLLQSGDLTVEEAARDSGNSESDGGSGRDPWKGIFKPQRRTRRRPRVQTLEQLIFGGSESDDDETDEDSDDENSDTTRRRLSML